MSGIVLSRSFAMRRSIVVWLPLGALAPAALRAATKPQLRTDNTYDGPSD